MIYLVSNSQVLDKDIINLKVCEIKYIKLDIDLSCFDSIVLTSKNAINALKFSGISPSDIRIFAMGKSSKEASLEYGFSNIFNSINSYSDEFRYEILPFLKDSKTLLLRSSEPFSDLENFFISKGIDIKGVVAYENFILNIRDKISPSPDEGDILIFTSPKNVRGFLANFSWKNYVVVAIGKSTAKTLQDFCSPIISQKQDIRECIKLVKGLDLRNFFV